MTFQRLIVAAIVLGLAAPAAAEPPTPPPARVCHDFDSPDLEGREIEGHVPGHSVVPVVRVTGVRLRGPITCRSIRRAFLTVAEFPHPVGWRCRARVAPVAPDSEPESGHGRAGCSKGTRTLFYRWHQIGTAIAD